MPPRDYHRPARIAGTFAAALAVASMCLVGLQSSVSAQDDWGRLQGFEDGDLSRWSAVHARMALDSTYVTQVQRNLRVAFETGGSLSVDLRGLWRMEQIIREKFSDEGGGGWKTYEAFFTDIYAPEPTGLALTFRDTLGGSWSAFATLVKGINHLQFRREQFRGMDYLALGSVEYAPARSCTLYFDHVRTWEYQPELSERNRMDIVYSDSVTSPHVPWQRPDDSGPVRGLFVPRGGSGRVMVELMQRFELQPTTVTFEPSLGLHRWAFGDFYGTRALGYDHVTTKFSVAYTYITSELEGDRHFDVIVLPNLRTWNDMPPELRRALLKRVSEGCGLVMFQPVSGGEAPDLAELSPLAGEARLEFYSPRPVDHPEERPAGLTVGGSWTATDPGNSIVRGVPLELIPAADIRHVRYGLRDGATALIRAENGDPVLAVGTYGKGRVAAFAWEDQGMFPRVADPLEDKNGLPYWEYVYALIGRSVRWAAGRDTPGAGLSGLGIERAAGGGVLVRGRADGVRAGDSLRVNLRNGEWENLLQKTVTLGPGGGFEVRFPGVHGAGRVLAEAFHVRSGGRVADFAAVAVELPTSARLASLELDNETVGQGDRVSGRLRVEGGRSRVALSLNDNRGRLIAVDTVEAGPGGAVTFSLDTRLCLARRAIVSARTLSGDGEPLSVLKKDLFVDRDVLWDDYEVMMYRFMPQVIAGEWGFLDRYMEELGITAWAAIPPEFVFRSNLGIQAETRLDSEESLDGEGEIPYREQKTNYLKTRDKKYLHRINCLHDPAYLAEQKEVMEEQIHRFKRFSPLSYYCYEEPSLTHYGDAFDLCFSPYTLAAFREWLKGEYVSLAGLNAQWGTRFRDWDEVVPDDTFEAQARGNYSSWADHRTFMEISYAGNYAYVREIVRGVDPEGLVMMTGTQRTVPHNGYDYYLLNRAIDHTQPYGEPERHKAFIREGGKITGCTGYGVFGPKLDYELWNRLFYGHTAGSAIFWQYSTIDPDYRLCKSGRDMVKIFNELRRGGVARLLDTADWTPSEVVLFWSMPSIHGSWIQDGRIIEQDGAPSASFDRWEFNYESWRWLLDDLGVPYRVMSWQMLNEGWLENAGAKVLVLPNTVALHEQGAESIRKFVEAGGSVISDAQAAVMDGRCKWQKAGLLDNLLGISGQRAGLLKPGDNVTVRGGVRGLATADSGVRPRGATAADYGPGFPTVYVNSAGQGRAFHLNAWVAGYGRLRQEGAGMEVRTGAARLLADAGYTPLIALRPSAGGDLKATKMTSYNLGDGYVIGLMKDYRVMEPDQDLDLELPEAGFHYDVRAGRYLGRGRTIKTSISTGEIKLLASLPYMVGAVAVSGAREVARGAEASFDIRIETAGAAAAGPHVLAVEVLGPDGGRVDCYGKNVVAADGAGGFTLPLALSDSPGRWRVRARDVATGVAGEWAFEVR